MTEDADPLLTFFSEEESEETDLLYTTLGAERSASAEQLRKEYRKAALRCHPDKHSNKSAGEREEASRQFQRVGFAWAVLSDEKRRKRYDATGRTDDLQFADAENMGWDEYFEQLFERIDRKILDEDKARYQASEEELEDVRKAYEDTDGSFPAILARIPHGTVDDEPRMVKVIEAEIEAGRLERTAKWTKSSKDDKARTKRRLRAEKEAKEAEEGAKELGVWDEFYGTGKKGRRAGDKGKEAAAAGDGEDQLAALIKRRVQNRVNGLDALEAKYRALEEAKVGKKKRKGAAANPEPHPAELDDDAFAALQAKMFGDKGRAKGATSKSSASPAKKRKTK